jgi:hypothetical protein
MVVDGLVWLGEPKMDGEKDPAAQPFNIVVTAALESTA